MDAQKDSSNIITTGTINIWNVNLSRKNIVSQKLVNILYTKEEIALLNEWVSPHEINTLNALFGKGYIISEYNNIISRFHLYNRLLKEIEAHDQTHKSYAQVLQTEEVLDISYNEQRTYEKRKLSPHNKKIDNGILIDLFSQGRTDLLWLKSSEDAWDWYVFNPQSMMYVDLFNRDLGNINKRWIKEIHIKDDSLRFVSLLPDNCANYIVSWFDNDIIKEYLPLGEKYMDYLTNEITRTTKQGWIVTWINFQKNELLEWKWMTDIASVEKEKGSDFYCYEKMS